MVNWFRRPRRRVPAPTIASRSRSSAATSKVDLAELTPSTSQFLGQSAYLQLTLFENLSRAVASAPTIAAKETLSQVASLALNKHHALVAELERRGESAADVMEQFMAPIDEFQRVTQGADWYEAVVTCYVTAGFLDDFFVRLAGGLRGETAARLASVLAADTGEALLVSELRTAIDANPRLASRLAMWGRRLVGDTMLVARAALVMGENHDRDEARIEPVFTELIAAHTRRMDALGLTA